MSFTLQTALPLTKEFLYALDEGLFGPRAGVGALMKTKIPALAGNPIPIRPVCRS